MSAQPANTSITIYRTLRTQRQILRHESVAAITKRLRPLVLVKPGYEILVGTKAGHRDTTVKDFSPYMGQAAAGAGATVSGVASAVPARGFPIVIELLPVATFAQGQAVNNHIDFAFQVGSDKFLTATSTYVATEDLFGDVKNLGS